MIKKHPSLCNEEGGEIFLGILARVAPNPTKLRDFDYARGIFKFLPTMWKASKAFDMGGEYDMHQKNEKVNKKANNLSAQDSIVQKMSDSLKKLARRLKTEDGNITTRQKCITCEAKTIQEEKQKLATAIKKVERFKLEKYLRKTQIKARWKDLCDKVIAPMLNDSAWGEDNCLAHWPLPQEDNKAAQEEERKNMDVGGMRNAEMEEKRMMMDENFEVIRLLGYSQNEQCENRDSISYASRMITSTMYFKWKKKKTEEIPKDNVSDRMHSSTEKTMTYTHMTIGTSLRSSQLMIMISRTAWTVSGLSNSYCRFGSKISHIFITLTLKLLIATCKCLN
ncbi:MAG: hypothetical protein DHS20C09_20370 [marine bacterium B5-7]|nr:MAG: hypothetical protein DHS20C09_20370 [marine bacterium B5-7]